MTGPEGEARADSDLFVGLTRELLQRGCHVRFRAAGTSMHPAIRDGEVVTVAPSSGDAFAVGDVLLCRVGRRPAAHRVEAVRTSEGGQPVLHLRGDNLGSPDGPLRAEDVIGRVLTVSRNGSDHPLDGPRRLVRVRWISRRLSLRLQRLVRIAASAARGIRQEKQCCHAQTAAQAEHDVNGPTRDLPAEDWSGNNLPRPGPGAGIAAL